MFDFEIKTNFELMKPISAINKQYIKAANIRDRYWASSLYAIEEEYVPTSLIENMSQIPEEGSKQQE